MITQKERDYNELGGSLNISWEATNQMTTSV